jgi:hypothetical protein
VTLQKCDRGLRPRPGPRRRQLVDLGSLHPQRLHDRPGRRPQLLAVAVERAEVEALFAVIPTADLAWARSQFGFLVAEHLAGPHVSLRVLDSRLPLGEAPGDV